MDASYPNPWMFDGRPFESEDINGYEGFVYIITNLQSGRKYIGRKYFHNIRKVKGKKRRQRSESDWKDYYGSSDTLKEEVEELGHDNFKRDIVSLHSTRGDANYSEIKLQFKLDVLESNNYINDNINGKWRSKPSHILEARRVANNYGELL